MLNTRRFYFLLCAVMALMASQRGAVAQVLIPQVALARTAAYSAAITSINGGFFNQLSPFVSSPDNPQPDQLGGGLFVRPTTGTFDVKSRSTSGQQSETVTSSSTYSGVQAGFDLGRYNLGSNGYSVNLGVTGGEVTLDSKANGPASGLKTSFNVPFVGAYASFAGHGFFADLLYRRDFLDVTLSDPSFSAKTGDTADTVAVSGGYRYNYRDAFFVEPSLGISFSSVRQDGVGLGTFTLVQGGPTLSSAVAQQRPFDSDLGRINVRVGKDFMLDKFVLEPFVTGSVLSEFADNTRAVLYQGPTDTVGESATTTRAGTFEQFSAGLNVKLADTKFLAFVRGDVRTGDKVSGDAVTGGLRYQF